jgi:polysaccharide export outer membrane protein
MRGRRFLVVLLVGLALAGCARRGPQYLQYHYVPAEQAAVAQPPAYPAPGYPVPVAAPGYQAPVVQSYPPVAAAPAPRGFFGLSLGGPFARAPVYRQPAYPSPCGPAGCAPAAPVPAYGAYAGYPQAGFETPYTLDAGDRLRITVFGQEGLSNSYAVDAAGNITMPLVGTVPARGLTTEQLSQSLTERLKQGYIREPKLAIEIEAYRPFFIHGEVATPGQYAYVANMTVENAVAIAGGFGPRADKNKVTLSRNLGGQTTKAVVGLNHPLRPGDTLRIGERWF